VEASVAFKISGEGTKLVVGVGDPIIRTGGHIKVTAGVSSQVSDPHIVSCVGVKALHIALNNQRHVAHWIYYHNLAPRQVRGRVIRTPIDPIEGRLLSGNPLASCSYHGLDKHQQRESRNGNKRHLFHLTVLSNLLLSVLTD